MEERQGPKGLAIETQRHGKKKLRSADAVHAVIKSG
jgi:hypothetical protein